MQYMRKILLILTGLFVFSMGLQAQSSMTDDQVLQFIIRETRSGSSQSQIVTKLMQRGVNVTQIQRVRKKFERAQEDDGLGMLSGVDGRTNKDNRTRKASTKTGKTTKKSPFDEDYDENLDRGKYSDYRIKEEELPRQHTYDENDEEFQRMMEEMDDWVPVDTAAMYEKLLKEVERDKKKRKVFGRNIFSNKNLSFEPAMNIGTPRNYVIGAGDEVFIDIFGASQRSVKGTVSPDGTVTVEGFGPINIGGLTVSQANDQLKRQMGSRYSNSNIRLTVGQTRTITVNVYGEVKTPGTYTVSAFATPLNALYMAGGISDIGTLRNIKVHRNGRVIANVDVYDMMLNGRTPNVHLQDNDVIYVGSYDCLVNVTGKVKRPMYYEMRKNESVATLLKYAGGFTGDAYTQSVRLIRKTGRQFSIYNVEEFDMSAFHLSDEDSLFVDSIISRFENRVEVKGAVFRPGMYQVGDGINSVRTLIESAEGLKEEAFTAHAVMHRMREDRTLEVVQVDVQGILDGSVPDIALKPNDVLFIPTKQEMMVEQTVTIHGEVHYPGIYKYAANETLEDLVLQAGGLTDKASTVKVDVARRITNPKALTNDSITARNYTFALKDGFVIDGEPGFILMPFDEVYVRRSPGTYQQRKVKVEGEVMFEGTYTLSKKTPRLSDLVNAAGGVGDLAYAKGARLERKVNDEERLRMEAVLKKQQEEYETNMMELAVKTGNMANMPQNTDNSKQVKKYEIPESYPVGIELDKALANPGGREDIVLREGDRLIVPQYNGTVKINGEVMYPNTVGYREGKSVSYYIDQAGGFSSKAKKNQTYIIYMNGTVAKVGHNAKPGPGSEIVVPAKSLNKMTMAETMSLVTAGSSLVAILATVANILK